MDKKGKDLEEREYVYSSTLSSTSALDGGGWSQARPRRFTAGKKSRYPLYRGLGGPQGRKISPPPGYKPRTVQPVASRYTDWAIPAHVTDMDTVRNLRLHHTYLM